MATDRGSRESGKQLLGSYRSLIAAIILVAACVPLFGGQISGQVRDRQTQQPLIAVNVMIDATETGTMTDAEGYYRLPDLGSGSYVIRYSMMGYENLTKINVEVRSDAATRLDVELNPAVLDMDALTITAPAFQKSLTAVVSERSIDLGELRADPGAQQDIQRSVQVLPSVSSGSDQMNEIIVRGGAPGENLFLIDGIEIPNPNHFGVPGTGGGPVNLINAEFVGDIDFYAGAFPAAYGNKASSVMDIRFREGNREKRQMTADMGMSGLGLSMEGPVSGGRGSYLVTAHKSYLDLVIKSTGLSAVPQYWNTQGKLVYYLTPVNKMTVNAVYGSDGIEIDAEESDTWSRGAEYVKTAGYLYAIGSTLQTNWSKSSYSRITAYRNQVFYGYNVDTYISADQRRNYADTELTLAQTALKGMYSKAFSAGADIQIGGEIKSLSGLTDVWFGGDTLFLYAAGTDSAIDVLQIAESSSSASDSTFLQAGAFASLTLHPLPNLKTVLGLRLDRQEASDELSISPRLGLSWAMFSNLNLNAGAGRHFQSPDYLLIIENAWNGAPALKSKYSDHLVAGIEYFPSEKIKITVEGFLKYYNDYPQPVYWSEIIPDTSRSRDDSWVNTGTARSRGIEFFLQKKMFDTWYAILSWSLSRSEAWDERYQTWYPWDYDYRHILNAVGGYRFIKSDIRSLPMKILSMNSDIFTVSFRYRYMGGRPYTPPDYYPDLREWYINDNHRNTDRLPSYSRFDIALQWKSAVGKKHDKYLVSYVNIQNLFNTPNVWDNVYNPDGTVEEVLQYTTFPVGGVILEF